MGTTWRRPSWHVSLKKSQGMESPTFRSSSPRPLRSFRKQEPCVATTTCPARLPIQARMVGCVSTSTFQGSTEPHLRSASGLRAWDAARVRRTATFACLSACRTWLPLTSVFYGAFWRLRTPDTTQSWRRWRWSSRNRPDPQSLPRLRAPVAREDRPLHRASSATPTPPLQWYQVTSFEFISAGSALRAAFFPGRVVCPCGMYPFCLCL